MTTERTPVPGLMRYLRLVDVPWCELRLHGLPDGVRAKVLREDLDAGIRTAVVEIPAGWHADRPHAHSVAEEVFVLEGDLTVSDRCLTRNWYAYRPAGLLHGPHRSERGARLLVMWGGMPDYVFDPPPLDEAAKTLIVGPLDVEQLEWVNRPGVVGPTGSSFGRKILRYDPATGADTRYLVVPAGFEGWGPNFHPIHEEIYCLDGEIGPDDDHILTRDSYLHNPPFGIHGYHEHSRTGATLIEWHSGKWEIVFMEPLAPGGRERPAGMGRVYGSSTAARPGVR